MKCSALFFGLLLFLLVLHPAFAQTIYDIQYTTSTPGTDPDTCYPSPLWNTTVTVTGIVTAVQQQGSYAGTYWIAEPPGTAWHGVYVFDRYHVISPAVGDSVTVTAPVSEYFGLTEVGTSGGISSGAIHSSGHALPDTIVISTRNIAADDSCSADGEQYESCLCILYDVIVTDTTTAPSRWKVADTSGVECLVDNYSFSYVPRLGQNIESICGVIRYSYGQFRLSPLTAADIVLGYPFLIGACSIGPTRVEVIFSEPVDEVTASVAGNYTIPGLSVISAVKDTDDQTLVHLSTSAQTTLASYTLTVINVEDLEGHPIPPATPEDFSFRGGIASIDSVQAPVSAENDSSRYAGSVVTITGIATTDSTAFSDYYVEMSGGGPWSGLRVHDSVHEPSLGDSLTIAGTVSEYYNLTELNNVFFYRRPTSGHLVPDPVTAPTGSLMTGSPDAEQYEDVLVRVERAEVVDTMDQYGQWRINDGSGACMVDDWAGYSFVPSLGETVSVTGILDFSYSEYKIQPRGDADIAPVGIEIGEPGQVMAPMVMLSAASPNPFTTLTTFDLVIPQSQRIELHVYNALGQRVKTLWRGDLDKGHMSLTWRGDTDAGRQTSSGIYFCLLTGEEGPIGCRRLVRLE